MYKNGFGINGWCAIKPKQTNQIWNRINKFHTKKADILLMDIKKYIWNKRK